MVSAVTQLAIAFKAFGAVLLAGGGRLVAGIAIQIVGVLAQTLMSYGPGHPPLLWMFVALMISVTLAALAGAVLLLRAPAAARGSPS